MRRTHRELAESPAMSSEMMPMMPETISRSAVVVQLVLDLDRASRPRSSAGALSCERAVIQRPRGQWSRLGMRADGPRASRRRGSGVRSVRVCSGTGCGRRGQVQESCEGLTLRAARRLRLKSSAPSTSAQPHSRRWRSGLTRASGQDRAHPCRRPPQRRSSHPVLRIYRYGPRRTIKH